MSGNYILDTNIVIALFLQEKKVLEKIKYSQAIFIPAIVIGELCYGAYNSTKIKKNLTEIDNLSKDVMVLNCTADTAKLYGQIKSKLKIAGKPIPENDIWIAALSLQYEIPLVSRDNHFQNIEGLKVITW